MITADDYDDFDRDFLHSCWIGRCYDLIYWSNWLGMSSYCYSKL